MATKRKVDPLSIRILLEIVALVTVLVLLFVAIGNVWASIAAKSEDDDDSEKSSGSADTTPSTTVDPGPADTSPEGVKQWFLEKNGLSEGDYPQFVWDSYQTCSEWFGPDFESRDFLLNYPLKKDNSYEIDISNVDRSNGVPLFMQWDERWGYTSYGASICGIGGCGPTSLSMVAYYLTGNAEYTPAYMMELAVREKYVNPSGGTNWSLFNEGPGKLGFKVEQLPNVERTIARRLEAGIPVVINIGESVFTKNGHYMVLVGYEDGKFRINDPNSVEFSQRLWEWDEFQGAVKNFWAISLPNG